MLAKLKRVFHSNITCKKNWTSLITGLILVFAYAPFSLWWLPFIVLPIWLNTLHKASRGQAFRLGYLFAFGWFASGISWVHVAIDEFGGLPLFVSIGLMLLLCLYLAFYPALACWLCAQFPKNKKATVWLFPFAWLLTEYLRSVVLTGFPWLSLGYSQIDGPLAALAPIIGEIGITFTLLVICVALSRLPDSSHRIPLLSLLSLIVVSIFSLQNIEWVQPTGKTVKVALVQGNIAQSLKWQPEQEWPTMLKYIDLTRINYDADIIVWPESAVPVLEPTAQDYLDMVNRSAALNNSAIITGIQNYHADTNDYYNGLIVLGKQNEDSTEGDYYYNNPNRYYKNHLLPIGEFVPFQEILRPLAPFFNLPMSSFSRGDYVQPNLVAKGLNILPLICFEIAFPGQLAANFTPETDILLTVSNDAWFGNSHGPHQHLEIARMRALEFGRPLIRVTNNGITAVINHKGEVIGVIPQFEEGVLKISIEKVKSLPPFYKFISVLSGELSL